MKKKLLQIKAAVWARPRLRDVLGSLALFLTLVGLDSGLRYIYDGCAVTAWMSWIPWIFTLAWAVGLTALTRLLPQTAARVVTALLGVLANILYLVNALMFRAKGNFFSFSALIFAEDGFRYLDASYLRVRKLVWILLVCGIIGTVLAVWLTPPIRRRWRDRAISLALIAVCVLSANLNREKNLTGRLAIHYDIYQISLLYDHFSDSNQCLMLSGLYQYTFRDFCVTYGVYDALNRAEHRDVIAELDQWYAAKVPDPDNEWTGRFKGKNLFLIQLEAVDTWLINETFMPNLYRIQRQSLDFTQNYTPLYLDAGTFNTEMIVNTGLVSPFTGSKSSMYSRNAYPDSLAHLMTAEGYTANSFHRSGGDTYNRAEVHENWGYSHYYSGAEMGMPSPDFDSQLMYGYDLMTSKEPFLSFIITYSGHGPYENSPVTDKWYDYAASLLPEGTDPMLICAYGHAHETDIFIGELYQRLEEDGLLDDTVLVFYADHYDYYAMNNDYIMEQKGVDNANLMTRTPFFIYEKNTRPRKIDRAMCAIDILPTIVNLFGLPNDGAHYVGNDAFSDNGGYAIFVDYSWYDGETYWDAVSGRQPTEEITARNEEIARRLQASWDTMRYNYFAK